MEKTKDVTQETAKEVHGTIFDDVFRTIAQKMPFLLIPLINEVFQTNYPEDIHFQQLRNEHYEKLGKIIFKHSDYHSPVERRLTLEMISAIFNL